MDMDSILTQEQKRDIIKAMVAKHGETRPFTLTVNLRYSWDFSVERAPGAPSVIFSVPFSSPRFPQALKELARALADIHTKTHAIGVRMDVCETGHVARLPGGGLWLMGRIAPVLMQRPTIIRGLLPTSSSAIELEV